MSMPRNNNPAGVVIALLIFVVFGFVFFIPSIGFFQIFTMFPIFFIIAIIGLIVAISSGNRRQNVIKTYKNENQGYSQKPNPYRVQNSQEQVNTSKYQRIEEETELKPIIRFCQYCGSKIERDAMFCHSCGSKLE